MADDFQPPQLDLTPPAQEPFQMPVLNTNPQQLVPDLEAVTPAHPSLAPQPPDPVEQYKQSLLQRANQLTPRSASGVRGLLQNFFSGAGQAMMQHVGMPSPQVQQQQLMNQYNQLQNTQSLEQMRQAQEQHLTTQDELLRRSLENQTRTAVTGDEPLGQAAPYLRGAMLTPTERAAFQKQFMAQQGPILTQQQAEAIGHPELAGQAFSSAISGIIGKQIAANAKPNQFQLIARANKGDQDAQAILDAKQKMDMELVEKRGMAFGQGRLWSLQKVYDPETGQSQFMTGFGILQGRQSGKNYIPTGGLGAKDIIGIQQLQAEAVPALANFSRPITQQQAESLGDARATGQSPLSAFDNPNDRAIFARVMKGSGEPVMGDEASWLGGIFNQAAKEHLSPAGKLLATQYGPRLAETMGRMRSVLGLQATDQAMGLTMRLLPGGSTPNSAVAKGQLKQIEEMIQQAIGIPMYGGGAGTAARQTVGGRNVAPEGTRVKVGNGYQVKRGGKWVPE